MHSKSVSLHVSPLVVHPTGPALSADVPCLAEPGSDEFVRAAGRAGRTLDSAIYEALVDFSDRPHPSGALLLKSMPVGDLPPTPPTPTAPTTKDSTSEFTLLTVARVLGHPVGYLPEHGGNIVQNLVPVRGTETRQVSTSSRVDLMFHTEAAFHPFRPRYLLLLCLRGDAAAVTTLSSIHEVLPHIPEKVATVLFEARFRTAVDESYLHGRTNVLGPPMAVLSGDRRWPSMVFDADLMVGVDSEADEALQVLSHAVVETQTGVALEAGDLLVVDNSVAVHGRTSYTPRFDGTDRWLQRAFVATDNAANATDRRGRVIVTHFGL